jgi:hypothetical protein
MGDLNYNYQFNESLSSNPLHTIESMFDMHQLVTKPTRVTLTTSTLLDVIMSNIPLLHCKTGVYEISISDHFLVYTVLNFKITKKVQPVVTFRNYKNFFANDFLYDLNRCSEIKETNWSPIEIDVKWNDFKKSFQSICNKHAPIQTRKLKNRNNPWMTTDIVNLGYERDVLKKKATNNNDPVLWEAYRKLRNKVTQIIRDRKREYAIEKIDQYKNDSKKMWKTLNRMTGRDKDRTTNRNICSQSYNDFFNTIGQNTVSNLNNVNTLFWKCSQSVYSFSFKPINTDSVYKLLSALGDKSSDDVLGFDSRLLHLAKDVISPILSKFFNASLQTNIVPDDWKLSRIAPIYKGKGSLDDVSNYRPISIISHVAKIMEKIVQAQVTKYLEDYKFITSDQSAYLKRHNTQTSLHRVTDDLLWNINDGLITGMCALDISKCFDTINHDILLQKLKVYGFDDDVVKWFKSYLAHRGHKTFCNNTYSNINYVNIGVPQGSVLGPLLFLLFVNDINNYLGNVTCNMYADDVILYCAAPTLQEVNNNLQNAINSINEWYTNNMLVVNASKSNAMIVTTRQRESHYVNKNDFIVKLGDGTLQVVDCCRYLGVELDKNLCWQTHINELTKVLNAFVWTLSRLRQLLPVPSLLQIYKSIVQPKIDYAITVWGYTNQNNLEKVQRMQNRVIRAILNNYDYVNIRGCDLLNEFRIMNVKQRRDYFMSLLMFKCIHGLAPDYLCNEIIMCVDVANIRTRNLNVNNVHVPFVNTECVKGAFSYQGPLVWNLLPDYLKEYSDLCSFKSQVKRFFLSKMY